MKKYLEIPLTLKVASYPTQRVLSVQMDQVGLETWCLGLCLLKERLVSAVVIQSGEGKTKFEISLRPDSEGIQPAYKLEAHKISLNLDSHGLDCVLHFYMKLFRDGCSAVDHLDLELGSANEDSLDVSFEIPLA